MCRVRTDGQNSRIMFDDDDGYSPAEYVIYNEKIYLPKREKISASKYSYCIVEFDIKTSTERKLFEIKEMLEQIGVEKGYLVTREIQNNQKMHIPQKWAILPGLQIHFLPTVSPCIRFFW